MIQDRIDPVNDPSAGDSSDLSSAETDNNSMLEQYKAAPVMQRNGSTGDDRRYDTRERWVRSCRFWSHETGSRDGRPRQRDREMRELVSVIVISDAFTFHLRTFQSTIPK
jgi:hypothetical protein